MRKIALLVTLFVVGTGVFAQSKLGLKFSPSISSNRVSLVDSIHDVTDGGSAFKFSLGLIYDHEITETYFFSTGLIFVPKQVAFHAGVENEYEGDTTYAGNAFEEYRLNYLQIPLSLKLFTNEVQPDTRIYFQVGVAPEIKVFDEAKKEDYDLVKDFRNMDAIVLFGAGAEYRAGINTTLFGGFTYQRGLANVIKSESFGFQDDLIIRNTIFSFDLGIKF